MTKRRKIGALRVEDPLKINVEWKLTWEISLLCKGNIFMVYKTIF